jgi:surface antigen
MPKLSRAMARVSVQSIVAGVLLATVGVAGAVNLGFLNNSPISYMKQPDLQALNNAARTALNTKQDGESLDWNNEGAGNPVAIKGTVTPVSTEKSGDQTCRKITLVAVAKGQAQSWTPTVCKEGAGKWQLKKQ